jgi:hypothetical protein
VISHAINHLSYLADNKKLLLTTRQ